MDAPPASLNLSTRPLAQKLVGELRTIVNAIPLEVPTNAKKNDLVKAIKKALQENETLSNDPRFTSLYSHRSTPKTSGKTSADKAAEEEAESVKPQPAPTGANRTLLAQKIKTDPPGQLKKLESASEVAEDTEDSDDEGSRVADTRPSTPEPVNRINPPVQTNPTQEMSAMIQVNFFNENNYLDAPRPVIVGEFPVAMTVDGHGLREYSTRLSDLIPAAVDNDSPIKARGGRLYRPNFRPDQGGHIQLGTVEAVVNGTSKPLQPRLVDEYVLHHAHDGFFVCDLFWDNHSPSNDPNVLMTHPANANGPVVCNHCYGCTDLYLLKDDFDPNAGGPDRRGGEMPKDVDKFVPEFAKTEFIKPEASALLTFTGKLEDIPLAIARDRASNDPMHSTAPSELRELFKQSLHAQLKVAVPGIPNLGAEWVRCKYAGQMRQRNAMQRAVFKHLEPLGGALGAYTMPRTDADWPGVRFKKEFVYEVLNIKSSSTTEIDSWFAPKMLEGAPKAREWVESDGQTNNSKFEMMKTSEFKEYLTNHLKGGSSKGEGSKTRTSRSRKHKKSDSDDEEVPRRRRRRITSEELDES
ncbi:hypothetical protein R3P38DRAFT_2629046 [Favolaschia claudopus]|uniref:SAP domain-containing protein n=1 Tax=Favolaschia claudopus TaxID=2862362 RepID=A0AAW0B5S8_9AGAR